MNFALTPNWQTQIKQQLFAVIDSAQAKSLINNLPSTQVTFFLLLFCIFISVRLFVGLLVFFTRFFFFSGRLQYFSRDFKHIMAKPYLNFQQLSDWPTVLQVKKCCHFVQNENVIKIIRSNVTSECLSLMKIMKNPKQASKQICPFNLKCWKCGMKCVRGEWIVVKQSTDKFYFVWHQKLNYYTFFVIRFE